MSGSELLMNTFPPTFHRVSNIRQRLVDNDLDEAEPLYSVPNPSLIAPTPLHTGQFNNVYDASLSVTPDKKFATTLCELRRPASSVSLPDEPSHRATKVHFDQTVAVHHLSPDGAGVSPQDLFVGSEISPQYPMSCMELDLSNLSYVEPMSTATSDSLRYSPGTLSPSSPSPNVLIQNCQSLASIDANTVRCGSLTVPLHRSKLSDSSSCGIKEAKRSTPSPVIVPEFGSSESLSVDSQLMFASSVNQEPSSVQLAEQQFGGEPACLLAKPGLNSTLRMTREIALLQAKQLDVKTVINDKIDSKLKQKVFEKACTKVNADSAVYPELISLQVSEDDLLNRVADEQLSRLKVIDSTDKQKPEEKLSRVPDVMDFFTRDLHKESASVTLVGVTSLRLVPRTADLHTAFDIYRHMRTWQY